MTLDTNVVIKNPDVHPEAVLAFINRELLRAENPIPAPWPSPHVSPEWTARYYPGQRQIGNQVGQGLFAIAEITVREPLAPITATYMTGWNHDGTPDQEWIADHEEFGETPKAADRELVTGSMVVSFDTAYGFNVEGCHCGDLHAYFVVRLAEEYGPVAWLDECRGDWHLLDGSETLQGEILQRRLGDPALGHMAVATREPVLA